MPEIGNLPIPMKLLEAGVSDMVRISDARMSGTAFGTVVLLAAPGVVGGPLVLVRDGDVLALDVPARRLDVEIGEAEMARRRAAWVPPGERGITAGGWTRLYTEHVPQADRDADLDFLVGSRGHAVPRIPF